MGLDFQTRLLSVNLTAVDKATQKEVEMFLIAIQKNPPTMNLDGYADINRGLITSVSVKFSISIGFDRFPFIRKTGFINYSIWDGSISKFSECIFHGNVSHCVATVQTDAAASKCKSNSAVFAAWKGERNAGSTTGNEFANLSTEYLSQLLSSQFLGKRENESRWSFDYI